MADQDTELTMFQRTAPLDIRQKDLTSLISDTAKVLRRHILTQQPQAYTLAASRQNAATEISIENNNETERTLSDLGASVVICKLAQSRISATFLWFSFLMRWKGTASQRLVFDKAYLHFYLQEPNPTSKEFFQLFRLEWCDRSGEEEKTTEGELWRRFQAHGAAHPHWQFDHWLTGSHARRQAMRTSLQRADVTDPEPRDFNPQSERQGQPLSEVSQLKWFSKVHFPSLALWPTMTFSVNEAREALLPHAHTPNSVTEITSWISSALGYVKYQFELYAE